MSASFPGTLKTFATHLNVTDIVDASHVNALQDEVVAIETALGTNPATSSAGGGAYSAGAFIYTSLNARINNIENGITADTHTQYLHKAGGDTVQASTGTVVPLVFQGNTGQSVNLSEWRNVGNTLLAAVSAVGALISTAVVNNSFGGGVIAGTILGISTGAVGNVGVAVKGVSGQSGDLLQLQDFNGNVLAKVNSAGAISAPNHPTVTAKGQVIAGTGSGTSVTVNVGTDGQVLTADSTAAPGVSWKTIAGGFSDEIFSIMGVY